MRIQVATWRDLAHRDAGGSEVHLDRITTSWADAGHVVGVRSISVSEPEATDPNSRVRHVRRGGTYSGVPRTVVACAARRDGAFDLAVDVWNGVPFMSPLWAKRRVVLLHHLHDELWPATFGRVVGGVGRRVERSVLPLLYRSTDVVTLSQSGRADLLAHTALRADRVHVVEPGIDDRFQPGSDRAVTPTMVAVCRFAPLKRVPWLIERFAEIRARVDGARLVLVGDGEQDREVSAIIERLGLGDAIDRHRHLSDDELVRAYQHAHLLVSASVNEGWGMTITEAAACGTPAVVSDCSGHRSAVGPGAGVVAADADFVDAAVGFLTTATAWDTASRAAIDFSHGRSWAAAAEHILALAGAA